MSELEQLKMLSRYTAWANHRLYETLAGLPEQELVAPRPIVFGSILRTLHHVYAMDVVWRAHLLGVPHGYTQRSPAECPPLAGLRLAQDAIDRWYIEYTQGMQESSCREAVSFSFIGGGEGSMRRGDIVLHVVNHTTYHRGHIGSMLYDLACEPPTTDLPVFLREPP
jgi:uncharacterized damage-inducible protein DinB